MAESEYVGAAPPRAETPYTETEALLAVMNDDPDRLRDLLAGMLPGELGAFQRQVDDLALDLRAERLRRRRAGLR